MTLVVRSVLRPRIGRSRALSRPWSHSVRLLAYWSVLCTASGISSAMTFEQRSSAVGADFLWLAVRGTRGRERPAGRNDVAALRHEDIDDLAVLVDGAVDVAPDARDLHVGLVYEPARSDGVAAWSRRFDRHRGEALHPPKQGDVINVDAALCQELLQIAVRQPEAQIPAHRQHDHLRRETEPCERRKPRHGRCGTTTALHPRTLAEPKPSVNATVPLLIVTRWGT
jgi:hypothetical protein